MRMVARTTPRTPLRAKCPGEENPFEPDPRARQAFPLQPSTSCLRRIAARTSGAAQVPGSGLATIKLSVPQDRSLRGATLYAQAMVVDPVNPVGLAFTAGRTLVLGD
jgi:hypothetical protein